MLHSISGALSLPVMPLLDTSATPNSNSCHRDSTAQRRKCADWRGVERKGGGMEGRLQNCRHTAEGQQQLARRQGSFYSPPTLQPDVLELLF